MRSGNSTPFKELGSSPVKGKRQLKRDAATTKASDQQTAIEDAMNKEYKSTSILMRTPMQAGETTASQAGQVDWGSIKTDAISQVVGAGLNLGVNELMKDKGKSTTSAKTPGFGGMKVGSGSSKIV